MLQYLIKCKCGWLLMLWVACCFTYVPVLAQSTRIDASNTDNVIVAYPTGAPNLDAVGSLNCDMLDVSANYSNPTGTDKLWAVAWGNAISGSGTVYQTGIHIGLENPPPGFGSAVPAVIELPLSGSGLTGANNPDVVLGYTNSGYYVTVVYEAFDNTSTNIYLETYEITLGATVTYTPLVGPILLSNTSGSSINSQLPHIDLFADPTGYLPSVSPPGPNPAFVPYMHKFIAVWQEDNSGTLEVWAYNDDIVTIASSTPVQIAADGKEPDVAATTDPHNNLPDSAFITYLDVPPASSGLTYNSFFVVGCEVTTPGSIAPGTPADYSQNAKGFPELGFHRFPRIDGATLYDHTDNNAGALWKAVVEYKNIYEIDPNLGWVQRAWQDEHTVLAWQGRYPSTGPGPYYDSRRDDFNYGGLCYMISPGGPPSMFCYYNLRPVISGTGSFYGGGAGLGNNDYTVQFYSSWTNHNITNNVMSNNGDFYAYTAGNTDMHIAGSVSPPSPGSLLWEVNVNDLNNFFSPSSLQAPVHAVGNCTNTGFDELSVWFDGGTGGDIRYKFGGTTAYAFKGTNNITNIHARKTYEIYPNPASTELNLLGVKEASYTVTNSLGQLLSSGEVNGKNSSVDVSVLPTGVYILNIVEDGHLQKFKFTKQ